MGPSGPKEIMQKNLQKNHYDHVICFLFCKVLLRLVGLLMVLIFTGGWIFDFAGRLGGN